MNPSVPWLMQDTTSFLFDRTPRGRASARVPRSPRFWKQLESEWREVTRRCGGGESRRRLDHLYSRLTTAHRGVRESAIAELEVAAQIVRTGSRVHWLAESRARTADLECYVEGDRLFIEVTAMIGAFRQTHGIPAHRAFFLHDLDGPVTEGDVLIHRILARLTQKARQLSDYCAPVVLAVSVPPQEPHGGLASLAVPLDLRRLAGAVTSALMKLEHLSGVLLSLWDVLPLPASSSVRLANVYLVERAMRQRDHPQVRAVVCNPAAKAPLTKPQLDVIRTIL
ncbi:hypothetical protein YTPLAS18_26060 [Nitrospira sp.]|nr:hypothetical protein YTPLAS18_26060 [Nitrospira sp.]